ncbi:MAG: hypothetical protein LBT74_04210 [Acidobacteriota bacterium]|jgi:hypothetical protein|nr:hypothetical protein [Acidobacteriota bacterium]
MDMDTSAQIRRKLATLIGRLLDRCLDEARMIPTVLHRDEAIDILVNDPARFARLVQEEDAGKTELSRVDLTVKFDAGVDLGKLNRAVSPPLWGDHEADLGPILDDANHWVRTFSVYFGNAVTLFDKEFGKFIAKFRNSLEQSGMSLQVVDFTTEDAEVLENAASAHFAAGEFLYAFAFERLLGSQIMIRQVVNLPPGFSLRERLMRNALRDAEFAPALMRFVLRISHVSQGTWGDLVPPLVRLAGETSGEKGMEALVDAAERDVVFSCNLLERPYEDIRRLPHDERRRLLRARLDALRP